MYQTHELAVVIEPNNFSGLVGICLLLVAFSEALKSIKQ
jgi:hypothetical protein